MKVFAHRGLPEGCKGRGGNSASDFARAFQAGYDVEMDVRRWHGRLHVSHDPILELDGHQPLPQFFDLLSQHPTRMALVGLKEDGLGRDIYELAKTVGVLDRIIVFDNSVPDLVWNWRNLHELNQMARSSEYEKAARRGQYVLLDRFNREEPSEFAQRTLGYIKATRNRCNVVLVSPEIHQDIGLWNFPAIKHDLRKIGLWGIITDDPRGWMEPQS